MVEVWKEHPWEYYCFLISFIIAFTCSLSAF